MITTKTLVAGILLLGLSSISQGGPINSVSRAGPDSDLDLSFANCQFGRLCGVHRRGGPRVKGPKDGNEGGFGAGAGAGEAGAAQRGGGSQYGGNEQYGGGEQAGSGAEGEGATISKAGDGNSGDVADVSVAATIPDPYADLPVGAPLPEGRIPGVNVLPREIPNYVGLEVGNPKRAVFQRFLNYDLQGAVVHPAGSHFLLYRGDQARAERLRFKREFNMDGLHKDEIADGDTGMLVDNDVVYPRTSDDSLGVPDGDRIWFTSSLESYGMATRAAQQGGILRVLADGKTDGFGNSVGEIDMEALLREGTFFYQFELRAATENSNLEKILVYNANDLNLPPIELWTKGSPPMGATPDWEEGTWIQLRRI